MAGGPHLNSHLIRTPAFRKVYSGGGSGGLLTLELDCRCE